MNRLTTWLRARRIESLKRDLAVVEAVIAAEARIQQLTGYVYPVCVERNARQKASIEFTLRALEGKT